jgi:hypothetical protein
VFTEGLGQARLRASHPRIVASAGVHHDEYRVPSFDELHHQRMQRAVAMIVGLGEYAGVDAA